MPANRDPLPPEPAPLIPRLIIGVFVFVLAGAGAWYFFAEEVPSSDEPSGAEDARVTEVLALMEEESLQLELAFDEEVTATELATPEQLALLEDAVRAQDDFVRHHASPAWGDRERLRLLEVKLATVRGRSWLAESERLERQSAELLATGDRPRALAALQEAWRLQRDINASPADDSVRRASRETELAGRLETIEAEPLAQEVDRLEAEAQSSLIAGDSAGAARLYYEAANFQRRLNQGYQHTRFSNPGRLDRLESEIASLGAVDLVKERDRLINQAAELDRAGVAATAAVLLAQARDLQAQINREFAQSRHASALRWDELEVARQTAASRPRIAAFHALEEQIQTHVRERQIDAARKVIEQAVVEAQALAKEFPRTRLLEAGWRDRVEFFHSVAPTLAEIQAEVADQLRPIPGTAVNLLTQEISQRLYAAVVGGNPSHVQGTDLPVDSVAVAEVAEFCRRLSWMLGRGVRLPTRAEFSAARAPAGGDAWTIERSGGLPRAVAAGEPNAAGFRDLTGNLAEWVQGDGAESFFAAGGSYLEPALASAEDIFRPTPASTGAPSLGFRVVVE